MPLYQYPVPEGRLTLSGTAQLRIPGVSVQASTALTFTANTLLYMPMITYTTIVIDALFVEVTSFVSGNNIRLGFYNADLSWQPTSLILDAGVVNTGTNGVKTTSFTGIALAPGRYLMAYHSNSTALGVRTYRGATNLAGLLPAMGASSFVERMTKSTAFAVLANPGVAWDSLTAGGNNSAFDYLCIPRVSVP